MAREYTAPACARVHRLSVDAYAVQHPGRPSPQSVQSVALRLVSLYGGVERGWDMAGATEAIQKAAAEESRFVWLIPPPSLGELTVRDV